MAADPTGRFVYAVDSVDYNIWAYSINNNTGALTPVPGSPFPPAGPLPDSVVADPTGRFVYVLLTTNSDIRVSRVAAYSINNNTGALTPVPGSPFPTGPEGFEPRGMAVDPAGRFVYVCTYFALLVYTIHPTSGALTRVEGPRFPETNRPGEAVAVDPTDRFVYVATFGSPGHVVGYTIDAITSALTAIPGPPSTGIGSRSVTVTPCASPDEPLRRLRTDVSGLIESLALNHGQGNSLHAKLNAAQAHFNRQDLVATANVMGAFIHEANALKRSRRLTAEQAHPLLGGARLIIRLLCAPR